MFVVTDSTECPLWVTPADLPDGTDPVLADLVCRATSNILWERSGGRFCQRTITGRPCAILRRCGCWRGFVSRYGWMIDGGGASWGCACGSSAMLDLPYPTYAVESVTIEGVLLDPGAYELHRLGTLVRTDGGVFPCCQPVTSPAGDPGTSVIVFTHGEAVPADGVLAARQLAPELLKAFIPGEQCALPERVRSLARPGITYDMIPAEAIFAGDGPTGLMAVDLFLGAVNPSGSRRPTRIVAP